MLMWDPVTHTIRSLIEKKINSGPPSKRAEYI